MRPGDFPIQANCDPKKPEEFAAWALVALPHMRGGALPMPSEYIQKVSKHLWDCGFRWQKSKQVQWYLPPSAGDPHWLTNPGRWTKDKAEVDARAAQPNMVDVLQAMKDYDETDFFAALNQVTKGNNNNG